MSPTGHGVSEKCPNCGNTGPFSSPTYGQRRCSDCMHRGDSETFKNPVNRGRGVETDGGRPKQASFGDFQADDDTPDVEFVGPTSRRPDEDFQLLPGSTVDKRELPETGLAPSDFEILSGVRAPNHAAELGYHPDDEHRGDRRRTELENDGFRLALATQPMTDTTDTDDSRSTDQADSSTRAVADGGEIKPEPVAIDPEDWDVSDHAGEEVLIITGITRVTSAPSTVTGEISGSGKTISAPEPHREDSTVRLDTETILSGESEYRDSRYFELYTPARLEKNQRSNHAPGPQAGVDSVTDPEAAAAPTHWPAIEQPDDVPDACPNCDAVAAPFQVEHVRSPRCENCGGILEDMEADGDDEDEESEPSAVNMQTWERGGVIETPDASLLLTRLSRAAGFDTVLRAEAVDEENREYLLRAPSHDETLYVERDGTPSPVVFTEELPDYGTDEAAYVGVDEERLRTWVRESYNSDYFDSDDDPDGGIDRHDGGDGPDDSGAGSSDSQADDTKIEEPPVLLADGGAVVEEDDEDTTVGCLCCGFGYDSDDHDRCPVCSSGECSICGDD